MSKVLFTSKSVVTLLDTYGTDAMVADAARISTRGGDVKQAASNAGLINYLMRSKHGSPFEHTAMTFLVSAPMFVFYEWHRHRAGWSYSEESARYRTMNPVFYVPPDDRPVIQTGTSAHPVLETGNYGQRLAVQSAYKRAAVAAWSEYESLLASGIAREVARGVLPTSLVKTMYATCNLRSLMHLLELRTAYADHPEAAHPSNPLWEFARVADQMEALAADAFPLCMGAWQQSNRVAP
jgi:thymidylate synthase (FAD)